MVNMLAAFIAWRMLILLRDGFDTRRDLALALLVALASLTKLSGLVLGGAVALAAIWLLIRRRDLRGFLRLAGMMLIAWLLIAGWWYARNLTLYGEPFGTSAMLDFFGRRSTTVERLFSEEFHGLRVSYWAVFGAFNTVAHNLFYQVMDALTLLGAGGLLLFAARNRRAANTMTALAFLALLLALGAGSLIAWSLQTWASTGSAALPLYHLGQPAAGAGHACAAHPQTADHRAPAGFQSACALDIHHAQL